MATTERITAFLSRATMVLKQHIVEMGLFIATYIVLVLGKNGIIGDTSFLVLVPIFITTAYCLNMLFPKGRYRNIYLWCWLPLISLITINGLEQWSDSPQFFITVAILCPIAILLCRIKRDNVGFVDNALSYAYAAALSLGLSGVIFGLVSAINYSVLYFFGFDVDSTIGTVAEYSGQAIFLIVCPAIFFALLRYFFDMPKKGLRLFDIVVNYIFTPALLIYTVILYLYFAKILVLWELPKGGVAYMVFGFTAVAMVVKAMQFFVSKKLYDWFFDRFTLISLPAQAMFWIGVIRRVNDFGLTESRVYLIVCGVVMTLFLTAFIFRRAGRYYALFMIVFVGFALMAYIPPFAAKSIAIRSQYNAAVKLSEKLTSTSDSHEYRRLLSAIDYLSENSKERLDNLKIGSKQKLIEMAPADIRTYLNNSSEGYRNKIIIHCNNRGFEKTDLQPYSKLLQPYSKLLQPVYDPQAEVYYKLKDDLLEIYADGKVQFSESMIKILDTQLKKAGYSLNALPSEKVLYELTPDILVFENDSVLLKMSNMVLTQNEGKIEITSVTVDFILIK